MLHFCHLVLAAVSLSIYICSATVTSFHARMIPPTGDLSDLPSSIQELIRLQASLAATVEWAAEETWRLKQTGKSITDVDFNYMKSIHRVSEDAEEEMRRVRAKIAHLLDDVSESPEAFTELRLRT
ncbi:hypothetical protein V8E36_005376 [Tilletia maclaganii]